MLESIENNLFEFRLQVITNPSQSKMNKKSRTDQQHDIQSISRNNKVKTSGTKSAYLSTIKKILELKSKVEREDQLHKTLKLKDGKETLKWSEFYFDKYDYYDCYSLRHNGAKHPMCIEGIIKQMNFISEHSYSKVKMELYRLSNKEVNGKTLIPSVFIHFHGKNLYRKIKGMTKKNIPSKVVVYSDNIQINSNGSYLNINPNIYNEKQMHLWD